MLQLEWYYKLEIIRVVGEGKRREFRISIISVL